MHYRGIYNNKCVFFNYFSYQHVVYSFHLHARRCKSATLTCQHGEPSRAAGQWICVCIYVYVICNIYIWIYHIILYYIILYDIILYYIILNYMISYYIILFYIIWYYIIYYYIIYIFLSRQKQLLAVVFDVRCFQAFEVFSTFVSFSSVLGCNNLVLCSKSPPGKLPADRDLQHPAGLLRSMLPHGKPGMRQRVEPSNITRSGSHKTSAIFPTKIQMTCGREYEYVIVFGGSWSAFWKIPIYISCGMYLV